MQVSFTAIGNLPLIEPNDDLVNIILSAQAENNDPIKDGDILVIAQKIVSKSENRYRTLESIIPSKEAILLAKEVQKDPRYVQAVLDESVSVVRKRPGVLIVEHHLGFIHANAGIDQSNITHPDSRERLLLLPKNPDASARKIRDDIHTRTNKHVAVIINDSMGRAWRNGTLGLTIGLAGMPPIDNRIGGKDLFGRELKVTAAAIADELSAGASLLMGQTTEKTPVVIVRGYPIPKGSHDQSGTAQLLRDKSQDLFR